jgi:hypothetical protein
MRPIPSRPTSGSLIDVLLRWWRSLIAPSAPDRHSSEDLLLRQRMATLEIDSQAVERVEPALFADSPPYATGAMNRSCASSISATAQTASPGRNTAPTRSCSTRSPPCAGSSRATATGDQPPAIGKEAAMRTFEVVRTILAKPAGMIAALGRESEFSCGDCERRERCGLPPSDKCIVRAEQIARYGGRPVKHVPYHAVVIF